MENHPMLVRAAASACVFRGAAVLLVQRGKPPYEGIWSLPGGSVEPGETAMAAATREVAEETGLACQLDRFAGVNDVMVRDTDGTLTTQFMIGVFAGIVDANAEDPVAASDARAARFVALCDLEGMVLGQSVTQIITAAWDIERSRQ